MKHLIKVNPRSVLYINGKLMVVVDAELSRQGELTLALKGENGEKVTVKTESGGAITTNNSLAELANFIQQG